MQQFQMNKNSLKPGTPLFGVVCGLGGVVLALSLLYLGFWRTLLIAVLFVLGYLLGSQGIVAPKAAQADSHKTGLVAGLVGIAVALCFIGFGFWRTLVIAVLFAAGYVLGTFGVNAHAEAQAAPAAKAEPAEKAEPEN